MQVASLELCKELYELSGWGKDDSDTYWIVTRNATSTMEWRSAREFDDRLPAYDLGYLLRKLQVVLGVSIKYVDPDNPTATDLKVWYGQWVAYTPWLKQKDYTFDDTPEDATAKLGVELFKQNILTKSAQ